MHTSIWFALVLASSLNAVLSQESFNPNSRTATLFQLDPIQNSLSFSNGKNGLIFDDNGVYNFQSDVRTVSLVIGELSFQVGIEGGREGHLVDLGTQAQLADQYDYSETVGQGQGYASIHFQNNTNTLLIRTQQQDVYQTLEEGALLYNESYSDTQRALPDHIYLARIHDDDEGFERVVKILVTSVVNDEYFTFRWDVLRDTEPSNNPPSTDARIYKFFKIDPLARTVSLTWNRAGYVFCDKTVCNFNSDIDFNWYNQGALTAGIEGGIGASFVDLGTEQEIEEVYDGQFYPFASIRLNALQNGLIIRDDGIPMNVRNESTLLFTPFGDNPQSSQIVQVNHLYAVRWTDSFDATFERIAKIKIISATEDTVYIRYELLKNDPNQDYDVGTSKTGTLYSFDPILSRLSLTTGNGGGVFCGDGVCNFQSDIDYGNYATNGISAGVEGGRQAVVVDLGSTNALATTFSLDSRDVYPSLIYNTSTHTIQIGQNQVVNNAGLSATPESTASALAVVDHIYIIRQVDSHDADYEMFAKVLVTEHIPPEQVTIRWDILYSTEESEDTDDTNEDVNIGIELIWNLWLAIIAILSVWFN